MRRRRIYKAHPNQGWRTSWSRAHSSRMYHTSYPVSVRRPALLDWTSSKPHLTLTPLSFFLRLGSGQALTFGSDNTWYEDFHLASPVPCPAHTVEVRGGCKPSAGVICWGS